MADQKISELTVDASLDGSEIVPVVQNGNKRTTAAAIAGTLPDATTTTAGKLSATDKTRLDQLGADDSPSFAGLTITGTDPVIIPHLHGDVAGTLYFHVKNTSGGTLTKGTPVSVVNAVGDTTTLEVVATNPGVAGRTHAHGLLYSELANNGFGHAVVLGELQGVNTAALASSSELWVGAAGGTTPTRPATAAQQVATVGRQHATTGTLLVSIEGVEPTLGGAAALDVGTSAGTVAAGDAPAAAITALKAEANPLPQYLQPAEIVAGTNMSVDTTTTPGSVILNATEGGSGFAGYQAERWITPVRGNFGAGSGLTANTIQALPFEVKRRIRVSGMGGRVTTVAAGSNIQFAVYDSTSEGIINNSICNTASLGGGTAQFISDTAITPFLLLPDTLYWWAVASDAAPVMQAVMNTNSNFAHLVGAASAAASNSAIITITAYSFAGTFGTWPNLSAASPSVVTNNRNAYPYLLISAFV
jgi:hypothetical protein